jgi:hypothetical protein
VRLAASGGPDQQNVGLRQLDGFTTGAGSARGLCLDALVVVVDGHGERLLRPVLPDHVGVQELADLHGLGKLFPLDLARLGQLFLDDLVAQVDALIADVDTWAGDELLYLLLGFSTEGTLE